MVMDESLGLCGWALFTWPYIVTIIVTFLQNIKVTWLVFTTASLKKQKQSALQLHSLHLKAISKCNPYGSDKVKRGSQTQTFWASGMDLHLNNA